MYVRFEYVPHTIFKHTRGQVSESMNDDTVNAIKKVNNKKNKSFTKNLKDILYQAKQSIDVNKY